MTTAAQTPRLAALARPGRGELLVLLVAIVPRLGFVLNAAGLRGTFAYDSSVYYAAADALVHGRLPYRDYVLLHPPGIVLVLTPFAKLGQLTADDTGFVAANLAFILLSCVNAALVVTVARKAGLSSRAGLAGGLFYAVWIGAVGAEYQIRLEPLGNFFVLCGLLAWFTAQSTVTGSQRRLSLLCGLSFGAAAAVKLWWIVALLIVLGWQLGAARRSRFLLVAGGAALALVTIDGPFFLMAPRQMWSMIVLDQLTRNTAGGLSRLTGVSGARALLHLPSPAVQIGVVGVTAVIFVVLCARVWPVPGMRLVVSLLVAQMAVLAVSPSWFPFYDDYLTPVLALTVAAAVGRHRFGTQPRRRVATAVGAVLVVAAAAGCVYLPGKTVRPYPGAALAAVVARTHCVLSDSPMALIELDALSRDLAHGCRNWVDVTGRTYGPDAPTMLATGHPTPRPENVRWQRDLTSYLLSGDAVTLLEPGRTGVGRRLAAILRGRPVLSRRQEVTLYVTGPGARAAAAGRRGP